MASTSPYTNNDYQAVSTFRPYQLPVNDIFKAISAQNEFWDAGARRVKSAYDSALDLKLSLAPNREIRDNFIKEAEKQMTKLSGMNLADPNVQRQGLAIFKPLMGDEGIVSDDQATRHIEKVNSDALSFRNKDNGKFYSATNHQYALTGAKEFKSSTDRMAGKNYLEKRKEYEPFYDPTTELSGILKNCKPDKASGETPQGYYIRGYSNESLSAAKVNSCLDAGLSDKARRQLEINGAVTYRNNPQALGEKYSSHLQGTRTQLAEQRAAIEGVLANKDNLKTLKPEQLAKLGLKDIKQITPEFLQSLDEKKRSLDDRIENVTQTVSKIQNGDFSPIQGDNFEPVARAIYSKDYMANVAEGFSYDFTSNTVKADPVQMNFFNQSQQNARQEDDQQHDVFMQQKKLDNDIQMKMMDLMLKKKEEGADKLKDYSPAELNDMRVMNDSGRPFSTTAKDDTYDQVTQKRAEIAQKRGTLDTWFYNQAKDYGYPGYKPGSPESRQWFENFKLTAGSDPTKQQLVQQYESTLSNYNILDEMYKNTQDAVDQQIAPMNRALQNSVTQLAREGNLTVRTGRGANTFNFDRNLADLAQEVMSGKASINREGFFGAMNLQYNDNGKPKTLRVEGGKEKEQLEKVFDWVKSYKDQASKVKKAKNEIMAKETVIQTEGYIIPNINDPKNPLKDKIASAIGMSEYKKNINIGQTDGNGRVIVDLNKPKSGNGESDYDYDMAMNRLMRYGAGKNKRYNSEGKEDPEGSSVLLEGVNVLDAIDDTNISSVMTPYVRSKERLVNPNKSQSTGYLPATNGRRYRLDISSSYNGGYTYKIIDQSKPTAPIQVLGDRQAALVAFEGLLQRADKK